ncbi:hypothetical protein A8F94_09745 [Bacillus sp. FJAT-27225]|uniref:hypothetical protein n=1 Tax=Bacillus sp. FJAT-27225 TaxID=1743144 RepID=UPI00080C2FFC|nr:hypothetical protein [Bacillus sp. FJAT-27225]OCA88092.1 hypothetical protein A8F94_09745 [Bacillus sp. FJAT-27225]
MKESVLEFRGINLNHLGMYFEELGAVRKTDSMPLVYDAGDWSGEILSEQELSFTKTFKVNAVHIRFKAETEDVLTELIKNYRYKTTRVGG